jgi:hypothetical protein
MTKPAKSSFDTPSTHHPDVRLTSDAPKHRAHRKVRRAWGQGLLSGLPFAEIVLLAGFLMSAGMFVTIDGGQATAVDPAPNADSVTR